MLACIPVVNHTYMLTCIHIIHTHTHTRTHTYIYTNTHTHAHTHTHTQICWSYSRMWHQS